VKASAIHTQGVFSVEVGLVFNHTMLLILFSLLKLLFFSEDEHLL